MKKLCIVLSLILITSLAIAAEKFGVAHQMKAFRKNIPPPQTLSEQNGFSIEDANSKFYTLTNLSGVAQRMQVDGTQDLIILVSYLREADLKIRHIAADALEHRLHVFPNGMSGSNITDLDSDGHARMVSAFAMKIAEQGAPADAK